MHLIATQEFHYDGKQLKPGTEFEAPELHGKIFIEGKRAKLKDKVLSTKTYETAAVQAESPIAETAHNPRGRYKRRDMRPQE